MATCRDDEHVHSTVFLFSLHSGPGPLARIAIPASIEATGWCLVSIQRDVLLHDRVDRSIRETTMDPALVSQRAVLDDHGLGRLSKATRTKSAHIEHRSNSPCADRAHEPDDRDERGRRSRRSRPRARILSMAGKYDRVGGRAIPQDAEAIMRHVVSGFFLLIATLLRAQASDAPPSYAIL